MSLPAISRPCSRISDDSRRRIWVSSSAIFAALFGVGAQAATYVVTANPDRTFTPAAITIYQHDRITFSNAGGVHNVRADNNSFWCSDDCSLNRSPSSDAWQDTVPFNTLGTFGYYCEQHGDLSSGMRGTIIVIDRIFVDGFETSMD